MPLNLQTLYRCVEVKLLCDIMNMIKKWITKGLGTVFESKNKIMNWKAFFSQVNYKNVEAICAL